MLLRISFAVFYISFAVLYISFAVLYISFAVLYISFAVLYISFAFSISLVCNPTLKCGPCLLHRIQENKELFCQQLATNTWCNLRTHQTCTSAQPSMASGNATNMQQTPFDPLNCKDKDGVFLPATTKDPPAPQTLTELIRC